MRRTLETITGFWLLCFLQAVSAAERLGGPADLSIAGPDVAKVGETIRLRVDGFPALDLDQAMREQLKWIASVRILVDKPRGVTTDSYTIDKTLTIKVDPFSWAFLIDFAARVAGDYVLVIDWNEPPYGLVTHRVQVGGGGPPPPDPIDPPPDQKVTQVTLVYEKDQTSVPRPVSLALQKLNQQGILATEFERNSVTGDGQVPAQYRIALTAAKAAGLPCLVVQSVDRVVRTVKDPKTEADVLEALKP